MFDISTDFTLKKTTCCQCSILWILMNCRLMRASPYWFVVHLTTSESHHDCMFNFPELPNDTRMLNKHNIWFHSFVTCQISLGYHVCELDLENWTFQGTRSTLLKHWSLFEITLRRNSCDNRQRVSPFSPNSALYFQRPNAKRFHKIENRECRPTSILHPKKMHDSVELCETEICFLHSQLIGTHVWLTHNVPLEQILNLQDLLSKRNVVTVMNIPQIMECFSTSSLTLEIRLNLFRTWSFSYCQFQCFISSFPMKNCWDHAPIDIGSPRSVMRHCLIHNGLRGSVEQNFFVTKWTFRTIFQEVHRVARIDRSSESQFSTLEKAKHGPHPTLNN